MGIGDVDRRAAHRVRFGQDLREVRVVGVGLRRRPAGAGAVGIIRAFNEVAKGIIAELHDIMLGVLGRGDVAVIAALGFGLRLVGLARALVLAEADALDPARFAPAEQRTAGADNGIPGLKDIPGLGWLFKSDVKTEAMQEVLIFITPRILPPQVLAVAAEGKDKAGDMKPPAAVR